MSEDDKKHHHKKDSVDAFDSEVSQEDIDRTVLELEDVHDQPHKEKKGHEKDTADSKALAQELEQVKKEAKDNYERYVRSIAELDNYKKRIRKETDEDRKFANEELIKAFIPMIDNLDRAIEHGENTKKGADALLEGVKMVHKQFLDTLEKFGVQQIVALGAPFDPNFHQALMQVKTNDVPPNTVVTEVTKGYILNGRLLRPSMVGVSVPDKEKPGEQSPWGDEEYSVNSKTEKKDDDEDVDDNNDTNE